MISVNGREAALSALRGATSEVALVTAPGTAALAGVGYWLAVAEGLRAELPGKKFTLFLECGGNAALAHEALRLGLSVVVDFSPAMFAKLAAIAETQGKSCVKR
jgi:hypothetical protein